MSDEEAFVAIKRHLKSALDASDYRSAKGALLAALRRLPDLSPPHRLAVEVLIWRDYSVIADHYGDLHTAIEYEEKLANRDPDDPYPHLALSRLYAEAHKPKRAAESFRRCAELAKARDDKRLLEVLAAKGSVPEKSD